MANILALAKLLLRRLAGSPGHPSRTYGILEYATKILQQQGEHTDIISVRDLLSAVGARSHGVLRFVETSTIKLT